MFSSDALQKVSVQDIVENEDNGLLAPQAEAAAIEAAVPAAGAIPAIVRAVRSIGKPTHIVSPGVVEVVIQKYRWEQAEFEGRAGSG